MSISLRCPACGKSYEVRDELAGKQARCRCGAAMKVPAPGPAEDATAWEDEVIRALGPSAPAVPPPPVGQVTNLPPRAGKPAQPPPEPTTPARTSRGPEKAHAPGPREPAEAAGTPTSRWWRVVRLAKVDVRRLVKRDPWRAAIGLAGVAYGTVAALVFVYAISQEPAVGLVFGQTAHRIAQAALAAAMAVGGALILKEDKTGPAWAGLAAVMYCFFPMWGLLPGLNAALESGQFLPVAWLAARYAVPMALVAWSLREQTWHQRNGEEP
jgi:hypothetical protein